MQDKNACFSSLNNGVVIQPSVLGGHSAALVLGRTCRLEGRGAVEVYRGANLGLGSDDSLFNVSGGSLGFGSGSLDGCCDRNKKWLKVARGSTYVNVKKTQGEL